MCCTRQCLVVLLDIGQTGYGSTFPVLTAWKRPDWLRMPVILRMPGCTAAHHMTSIREQRDSDLISDGLLLIKSCRQRRRPPPPPPPQQPSLCLSHTILWFLHCSLPKKGLICSSMESWDLTFFFSFLVFFFRSFCYFFLDESHYLRARFRENRVCDCMCGCGCVFARFTTLTHVPVASPICTNTALLHTHPQPCSHYNTNRSDL